MANNEADDTATLVNRSGKPVRNFSYEEIRRLIGKSGTTRELNNFVSFFLRPFLSCDFYTDGCFAIIEPCSKTFSIRPVEGSVCRGSKGRRSCICCGAFT